ncbi:MAG: serine/threonine-protein kinase, partial [Myxococcota bacterium]
MIIGSGSTLDGRYELERRLGRGGFGEVFAATHVETRRPCAIKLLAARPETADREDRLLREAHLAAALVDDHITRVLDAGIHDGIPFVVMERLEGEDLGRRLERSGAFPPGPTALFSLHVARALTAAHAHDIVHLDLKPRNMFLTWTADGRPLVKLLDFGTAKLLRHTSEESSTLLAGTPVYMAPEQ